MNFARSMTPVRRLGGLAGFLCLITAWAAFAPPAAAIEVGARQAILLDIATGKVVVEKNEEGPTAAGALSKKRDA